MSTSQTSDSIPWTGQITPYGRDQIIYGHITEHEAAMDAAIESWRAIALQFLRAWCAKNRKLGYFIADRAIMGSRIYGLEQPADARAWGQVFQRAKDEGIIAWVSDAGVAPHRKYSRTAVWKVC
jgi:hypothetical protein